jgi:flagellar biosynthesis/type III secretory pathway M-ring protein FliF/YscJ
VVVWIVVAAAVLAGLIYLALAARALLRRLAAFKAEQDGLQRAAGRAQELAEVAQGLQAHADSLKVRAELLQERVETIKETRAAMKADPGQ